MAFTNPLTLASQFLPSVPQLPTRTGGIQPAFRGQAAALARSTQNVNYTLRIISGEQGILIKANLPETVGTDVSATYEAPFAQGLTGQLGPTIGAMARFFGASLVTQAMTIQVWQGGAFIEFLLPLIFQAESDAARQVMQPIKDLLKLTMPVDSAEGGGFLTAPGPVVDPVLLLQNGGDALNQLSNNLSNVSIPQALTSGIGSVFSSQGVKAAIDLGRNVGNKIAKPLNDAILKSIKNNISLHIGQFLYFPSVIVTDVSPTYDVMITPDGNPMRATVNVTFRTFYMPTNKDIELMFPMATNEITGGSGGYIKGSDRDPDSYGEG